MSREELNNSQFDCVIIGGGIVGSGLFREQSLHNLKTLILDQADFNSQTSQGSSKMLHGGIRYLEQLDFFLVFEALKEKKIWIKLAPHLTREMPLILPVYKHSKWPLFALKMGLLLYDILSLFKNPAHKIYNKALTTKELPGLNTNGLKGSGMYYDGWVDDAKLGLECIYDGLQNPNAQALNYKKVHRIKQKADQTYDVFFRDVLTHKEYHVNTKTIQVATGPFTDQFMQSIGFNWDPVILPSKGSHIWLKHNALKIKQSMVLQTKDGRIIFVIPSHTGILVGTTEVALDPKTEMLDIKASQEEIDYLLDCVREYFPEDEINHSSILSSFAAIRPLVKAGHSQNKTSRKHKIYSPKKNIHVLVGGKYTTFRKMAQDLNKIVFKNLGIKHHKELTLKPFRKISFVHGPVDSQLSKATIDKILEQELVRTKEDLIRRRLSLPSLDHLDEQAKENFSKIDIPDLP